MHRAYNKGLFSRDLTLNSKKTLIDWSMSAFFVIFFVKFFEKINLSLDKIF